MISIEYLSFVLMISAGFLLVALIMTWIVARSAKREDARTPPGE